jgi:gamma-glutamylcyclotransferase (GGCT)/AIG2-like uncharacterized protein YtfP
MKLCVYGTLRRKGYLHHCLDDQNYLGTTTIRDYAMVSLGTYPAAVRCPGTVIAEVYNITPKAYQAIESMERRAGYAVGEIETDYGMAKIFYYPFITDWIEYEEERRKRRNSYKLPPTK